MTANLVYQNLRGVGRGMPTGMSAPIESWDEISMAPRASSPTKMASTNRIQRFTVPVQLSRTPVKQSVPKSYVGVSTDDETDLDEQTSYDNQRQRRDSEIGCRASSPTPAAPFQRNSKVYRSFGGFGSKPITRPAPKGIMRSPKPPKPPTATKEPQKAACREETAWDYEVHIKMHPTAHPTAPAPRRRFHSGDRPSSDASGSSPPKKLNDQSFLSKLRQGLDFGASFSSRRSSRQEPESLGRMPQPGTSEWRAPPSLGISSFKGSLPISERPRIIGGFGRGFPTRQT